MECGQPASSSAQISFCEALTDDGALDSCIPCLDGAADPCTAADTGGECDAECTISL